MKKLFGLFICALLLLPLILLPFLSDIISESVRSGISVCIETLFPSLFPFMFLSCFIGAFGGGLISEMFAPLLMPLLGISKNACRTVILGLFGGFPTGGADAATLYSEKKISKEEAERLPIFCNNAGLMFTLGTVGITHFGSFKAGVIIYFYHLFSSLILALLTRKSKGLKKSDSAFPSVSFKDVPFLFSSAVSKAIKSMALISGNFIIFRVISAVFTHYFRNSLPLSFLTGLFEVTGGILSMPKTKEGLILTSFLLSFNGLCVHMQAMAFFAPLKLSIKNCIIGKTFSAFITAFLMLVSLPRDFMPGGVLPPLLFYVAIILLPVLLLIPYCKNKASDTV